MSRWGVYIAVVTLLLLVAPGLVSGQEVDEVKYAVMSNGSDALIPLLFLSYWPYCPPLSGIDCNNATTGEVLGGSSYLLYFNGSRLYLLNFTPAFTTLYPNYTSLLDLHLHGARFINGSWYLNITFYPPMAEVSGVYRFNPSKFCIEPTNISWFQLSTGEIKDEIDGWRIELQSKSFENWDYANVSDIWVTMSKTALRWSPGPTEVVNSSVFPIYFILKKGKQVWNITLLYLNLNTTREDFTGPAKAYWFPKNVEIANVTVCRSANVEFPITALRVDGVYRGRRGVILVVNYEVLSPKTRPWKPLNNTLVPNLVSYYLFYVSKDGPYFLSDYPEEPVVKFEDGFWRFKLHLWNGSVENVTFNPASLNKPNVSPVEVPNVSIEWASVRAGNLTVSYPAEFLGYSWGCNYTLEIQNRKILRVLPYVPFAVGVNGRFYPLFKPAKVTSQPVPPKVDLNFTTAMSTTLGKTTAKTICGPGFMVILAVAAIVLKRLRKWGE
ncbi:hypothetical protein [Thermococcus prieurii]